MEMLAPFGWMAIGALGVMAMCRIQDGELGKATGDLALAGFFGLLIAFT